MRKPTSEERNALAGMAAVLIFVCALSFTASYFERDPTNGSTDSGSEQNSPWWSYAAVWETLGTWAIAIYAIRQYAESGSSSERQLRAYVHAIAGDFDTGAADNYGKFIRALFRIENRGQTPAYKLTIQFGFRRRENLSDPLGGEEVFKQAQVLAPNGGHAEISVVKLVADLTKGEGMLIVGRIDYVDAFGNPQWTTVRFSVIKDAATGNAVIMPDVEGNDAT